MQRAIPITRNLMLVSAVLILALQLGIISTSAQNVATSGLSKLTMSNYTIMYLNDNTSVPFTLNLISGSSGATQLIIVNGQALAADGLYVGLSPSSGSPNFNGKLYINTNVEPNAIQAGNFTLRIESGGADPFYPGVFNFTVRVLNYTRPPFQLVVQPQNYTTVPPGVVTYPNSGIGPISETEEVLGVIIAAIIVVMVLMLVHRADRRVRHKRF